MFGLPKIIMVEGIARDELSEIALHGTLSSKAMALALLMRTTAKKGGGRAYGE